VLENVIEVEVSFEIINAGDFPGKEVAQIYVRAPGKN